jgi:hypothetical protein
VLIARFNEAQQELSAEVDKLPSTRDQERRLHAGGGKNDNRTPGSSRQQVIINELHLT